MSSARHDDRNDPQPPAPARRPHRVVVSACLLGRACRYDGGSSSTPAVVARLEALAAAGAELVAVCPEATLGVPRPPASLYGGDGADVLAGRARVLRNDGGGPDGDPDVTDAFVAGARAAHTLAAGASAAVLKARSPSCGVGTTHRDGGVRPGDGLFAALLRAAGVALVDDEHVDEGHLDDESIAGPPPGGADAPHPRSVASGHKE